MAPLPMWYICDLFAKQTPTLLSWPIYISINLMLIITPLKPNTRTIRRPIPTCHLGGNGVKRNRQLQLLPFTRRCQHKHVVSSLHFTQNTLIYSRNKPLKCYHGRYTYQLISCLLRRLPCGQQVGLNDIWKKKWRLVISLQNKPLNFYHKDIYRTYSDKQTTKRSAKFTTLM